MKKIRCRMQGIHALSSVVAIVVTVAMIGGCGRGPTGLQGEPGRTLDWSDTIADGNLAAASYAIGISVPELAEGADFFIILGSGFSAHYGDVIWTNAHVADSLRWVIESQSDRSPNIAAIAVRSGTAVGGDGTYQVDLSLSIIHPEYDGSLETPDVAALRIDASLSPVPSFLPRELATELRVGQPLGTLGFPAAIATPYKVVPVATFKDGVISALRPYSVEAESVTSENSRIVQHNLDLSPGTSGSAIFDHKGFIVAVNSAGTVISVEATLPDGETEIVLLPTGNIGLAIRVDDVWSLIDAIDAEASQPVAAEISEYPHRSYHAFPERWNGTTTSSGLENR